MRVGAGLEGWWGAGERVVGGVDDDAIETFFSFWT